MSSIEDWPESTWVYGLIYPPIGIFYIGVTVNLVQRFAAHWAAAGDCSSYRVIQTWKSSGQKFDHIIFGEYEDRVDALRLERALVDTLPNLVNKTGGALLSRYSYPVTEVDEILLRDAYERIGWRERAEFDIDHSGEYVDERYDDLDLIEAP